MPKKIKVVCTVCKREDTFPEGFLTLEAQQKYKCEVCREEVLENRVEKQRMGKRKLLLG